MEKKKKLTLTISPDKTYNAKNYLGSKKTSIVVEKKISRKVNDRRVFDKGTTSARGKPDFLDKKDIKIKDSFQKKAPPNRNFDLRKMAEERATKRFKNLRDDDLGKKKN